MAWLALKSMSALKAGLIAMAVWTSAGMASANDDLAWVDVATAIPGIQIDLRYATANNFTGQPLYAVARCWLRRSVADQLRGAQAELAGEGLGLKVFDAYRPWSVQKVLWSILPDPRYVADPAQGSRHNRGAAVDVTLVDRDGYELAMPSDYDEFSERAHRDYAGASADAQHNREHLAAVMSRHGFSGLPTEWWHFDADGWERYPISDEPLR